SGHPGVAVGGAGGHAFEKGQDPVHLGHVVQGGHEVHLRGARIAEADVDTRTHQGGKEGAGAVHAVSPGALSSRCGPRMPKGSKTALMERMRSRFTASS